MKVVLGLCFLIAAVPWVRSQEDTVGGRTVYPSNDKQNWFTAADSCRSHGRQLLEVDSKEDNAQAYALLKKYNFDEAWIGLTDLGLDNVYIWSQSGKRAMNHFWAKDAWDDMDQEEDCMTISSNPPLPLIWFDRKCLDMHHYICQDVPSEVEIETSSGTKIRITH